MIFSFLKKIFLIKPNFIMQYKALNASLIPIFFPNFVSSAIITYAHFENFKFWFIICNLMGYLYLKTKSFFLYIYIFNYFFFKNLYPVSTSVRFKSENKFEHNVINLFAMECQKNNTLLIFEDLNLEP